MRRVGPKLSVFIAVGCVLTIVSGCGSGKVSQPAPAQASATPSVSKQAGVFGSNTDLTVVNRSGRDMTADICHDGYCNGTVTLKDGESVKSQGAHINGWVRTAWTYGEGPATDETGHVGTVAGSYPIDFTAYNPDVGLPFIDLTLPNDCRRELKTDQDGKTYSSIGYGATIQMVEGEVLQTPANTLCSYGMVGSRSADTSDYKVMTLEVYAPKQDTCWELILNGTNNPSWSCVGPGPRPPSTIPDAPQQPAGP